MRSCVGCEAPFVPDATETICPFCIAEVRAGGAKGVSLYNTLSQTGALPPQLVVIPDPTPREREVACPFCAEKIKAAAIKCKHCGSDLEREPEEPAATAPRGKFDRRGKSDRHARQRGAGTPDVLTLSRIRSPSAAAALSFLLPGLGQAYAGAVVWGIVLFVGCCIAYWVAAAALYPNVLGVLFAGLALHLFAALEAASSAHRANAELFGPRGAVRRRR